MITWRWINMPSACKHSMPCPDISTVYSMNWLHDIYVPSENVHNAVILWEWNHTAASRPHFYQTRSAWSVDQGSNENHSPAYNFTPTVTKFCVMWEGLSLPHDTKFGNCRCKIVDSGAFPSWSLIHGLRWSGLIKAEPGNIKSMGWCTKDRTPVR